MKKKRLRLKKNIKQMLLYALAVITGTGTTVVIIESVIKSLNEQILWMQFCIGFSAFLIGTIVICLISDSIEESKKQKRLINPQNVISQQIKNKFATKV